tara:strand:- start:248 stop:601 length:354 start_codon:yes stop_codon:yes gene_type:complete
MAYNVRKNRVRIATNQKNSNKVYSRTSTRRQKARTMSTNRMLENQHGIKFKNNQVSSDAEWLDKWCVENGFAEYSGKDNIMKKTELVESGVGDSVLACPPGQMMSDNGCVSLVQWII